MTRVLFLSVVATLMAACGGSGGGDKSFESLCTQTPAPAACQTACDPSAAVSSCPSGFHCSGNKCDAVCTSGGSECGKGFTCTTDGSCIDDGGGNTGPDGGGPVGGGSDDACVTLHFSATKTIPSIQLLIDRSGSMLHNFADDPSPIDSTHPQKYPVEVDSIVGAMGVVTQLQGSVNFGASMFPGTKCTSALFTVGRALNNKTSISDLLNAHKPDSMASTPTAAAIASAVQELVTNKPPPDSPPAIVLVTDGLPNDCSGSTDTQPTIDAAASSFTQHIPLYLLAVGTKIDPAFEQQLANAGQGVAKGQPDVAFFTATDPASLATAFQDIIRGVVSCDLAITNGTVNADDAASGTVTVDGKALTYMTDWTLDDTGTIIHVLGDACTALKNAANPTVDAAFPCGGGVIF